MRIARFVLVGAIGLLIDAGLTHVLYRRGLGPLLARGPAIGTAMAFTWLANRRFTYAVPNRGSLGEVSRYVAVAGSAALLNYLFYMLLVDLSLSPMASVAAATACQVPLTYWAFGRIAFRK